MKPIERTYEKFTAGANKPSHEMLYASLSRHGRIMLNENAYRQLGKPPAVYLYYSRPHDRIAIEPVDSDRMPSSFPLRRNRGVSAWRINASPFCQHHNIRVDATQRFIAPEIEDGRMYLKLGQTVTIRKPRRPRTPQ